MKVLITAGPTREPIDSVRFITNASSGKMGVALAEEAIARGHEVAVIAGPIDVDTSKKIKRINVRTAREMTAAVLDELKNGYDVFISAAAIADYTPVKTTKGKLDSDKDIIIKLKKTRKLIKLVKKQFPDVFVVGFKAEFGGGKGLIEKAYERLTENRIDLIVANDIEKNRFGSGRTEVWVVDREKNIRYIPENAKKKIAAKLWKIIETAT